MKDKDIPPTSAVIAEVAAMSAFYIAISKCPREHQVAALKWLSAKLADDAAKAVPK